MPRNKKSKTGLGRSLIKQKNAAKGIIVSRSQLHTLNPKTESVNVLESITEQTDIADFMNRVELSEQNYEARTMDVRLLTNKEAAGVLTKVDEATIQKAQALHRHHLRIPRRPHWDEDTTKEELHEAERYAFTNWRLDLHKLSSVENLTLTPYEKNSQVWQQLWRVVERSDVVVQIVDARNPMLFRCRDLDSYVKEVDSRKVNLLLVNKSDFLTEEQREVWAQYFQQKKIYAVFFSALAASAEFNDDTLDDIEEHDELDSEQENNSDIEDENTDDEEYQFDDEYHQELVNNKSCEHMNEGIIDTKNINSTMSSDNSTDNKFVNKTDSGSDYESAGSDPESLVSEKVIHNKTAESQNSNELPELTKDNKEASFTTISKLYNREELIELLGNIMPAPILLQKHTTIGLVGYPNVGKSSTINCLMQSKKVTVSATPGKTKHFQTLHLSPELVLCDCPGLVFPGFVNTRQEMILWGILSIDRIKRDYHSSILHICHKLPPFALEAAYSIPLPGGCSRPPSAEELLSAHAVSRSFMSARGRADTSRSGRAILKDFMNGQLLHCVAPPTTEQQQYHTYTSQLKCKNRVKFTPQQELFMPETNEDIDAHLDFMLGIEKEQAPRDAGGKKARKQKIMKPKGFVEVRNGADGVECVITKPWRNRGRTVREGKKNPNTNDPYGKVPW